MMDPPLFRQLWDHEGTGSYTYILGDPATRQAVMIDPVLEHVRPVPQPALQAANTSCWAGCTPGARASEGAAATLPPSPQVERDLQMVDEMQLSLVVGWHDCGQGGGASSSRHARLPPP